jgi:hypothetical protein
VSLKDLKAETITATKMGRNRLIKRQQNMKLFEKKISEERKGYKL